MKIELELSLILAELYRSIPHMTPSRYELIYGYAEDIWSKRQQEIHIPSKIVIDVNNNNEEYFSSRTEYCLSLESIAKYEQDIPAAISKLDFPTFDQILLPKSYYCCDQLIPYYASITLYTLEGMRKCRSYHATCKKCKFNYYPGFSENLNGSSRVFEKIENMDFIMFTSGVAFEKKLLIYFDNMTCIGSMTFEQLKDFYSPLHSVDLNPNRIEANWFMYRIVHHVQTFNKWPRKEKSKELDIETLCGDVFSTIKSKLNQLALQHVCDDIGCKEKFIVIDGNDNR